MKKDIKKITGTYAGKLTRASIGDTNKRQIVINARILYNMLHIDIPIQQWYQTIEQSPLRKNIDYRYTTSKDTMLLSISAMQAILVICNTQQSWQLHHTMTDLIHTGFSNT